MAPGAKKQEKIGFSEDLRERVRIWQFRYGYRSFSGAVRALVEDALDRRTLGQAEELGRLGKQLNQLLVLANGRRTAVSREQAELLAREFVATLPVLQAALQAQIRAELSPTGAEWETGT